MGSIDKPQDEITVLITGFGPFKDDYPQNPSWEVASQLPEYLPPGRAKSASDRASLPLPPVRLLVHPEPVRVNYQTVRSLIPELWAPDAPYLHGRKIDLALHIGMASPKPQYCIERLGHRDGYNIPDVDGHRLADEARHRREGPDWIWHGVPPVLETELDLPDILARWTEHLPDYLTLKMSNDAGHFLCDFIYFSSLAHLWKAQERRRVVFLHLPADASPAALYRGREIVIQLVRSIVESEISNKRTETQPSHDD